MIPPQSPSSDTKRPSGRERRQWNRARAEWPVMLQLEDGAHEAKIRDVSRGGVCFFLDRPVPEMTVLQTDFELPVASGVRRIRGQGVVVRCERISQALEHYEIAVFTQEMAEPDRDTIETYVKARPEGQEA